MGAVLDHDHRIIALSRDVMRTFSTAPSPPILLQTSPMLRPVCAVSSANLFAPICMLQTRSPHRLAIILPIFPLV